MSPFPTIFPNLPLTMLHDLHSKSMKFDLHVQNYQKSTIYFYLHFYTFFLPLFPNGYQIYTHATLVYYTNKNISQIFQPP